MALRFLIVEFNPEGQFLLSKTLKRKFPTADLRICEESDAAVALVRGERIDAMIVHRAADADGVSVTRLLRAVNGTAPLVLVSGIDRTEEARAAGATCFLDYGEWLRLGTLVAGLLATKAQPG